MKQTHHERLPEGASGAGHDDAHVGRAVRLLGVERGRVALALVHELGGNVGRARFVVAAGGGGPGTSIARAGATSLASLVFGGARISRFRAFSRVAGR